MANAASEKDTTLARRYAAATAEAANVFFLLWLVLSSDVTDRDVEASRAEAVGRGVVKDSPVPMERAVMARLTRVDFMVNRSLCIQFVGSMGMVLYDWEWEVTSNKQQARQAGAAAGCGGRKMQLSSP